MLMEYFISRDRSQLPFTSFNRVILILLNTFRDWRASRDRAITREKNGIPVEENSRRESARDNPRFARLSLHSADPSIAN